jgi:hypothetical protein
MLMKVVLKKIIRVYMATPCAENAFLAKYTVRISAELALFQPLAQITK